jgi:raffinose/stachyose/melibiose transport system substrate-binding protein
MTYMRSIRNGAVLALAATAALTVAACGGSSGGAGSGSASNATGNVTLTWWNNATANPLKGVWAQVAGAYHATHPHVTIQIDPIQNEQFTTKIPLALQSGSPPDIYQQWGGGQEATQVKSGKVMNITGAVSGWIGELGSAAQGWQVNGQQYGIPYDLHMVGFWYRKDLFAMAHIASPPTTMAELNADVAKLKAAHIVPIAVGSKDRWPDAFWWEYFALRDCSTGVLRQAMKAINVSNPCFLKAGNDLQAFMNTKPFQSGFLGTASQQGAGSSAGMVANGKAAMELQGDWEPGVMASLSTDKTLNSKLGWFPFPAVTGGAGAATTLLGGGDGFSCTTGATAACAQFLKYLDSPTVQAKLVGAGVGLPANPAAASALTDPTLRQILTYSHASPFIQNYFDIAFPTNVGQAVDNAVANFFAGQGTPATIIQTVNQAASTS